MSEEIKQSKTKAPTKPEKVDNEVLAEEAPKEEALTEESVVEEVIELEVTGAHALVFGGKINKFGDTIVVTEDDLKKQSFIHLFARGQLEFKGDANRTRQFVAGHGGLIKNTHSQSENGPEYK